LRRLIASLSRTYLQVCRPTPRRTRNSFLPQIEIRESRTTPSVDVWTGANQNTDLNGSDPRNWSLGHAPTSTDIAQFTSSGVNPLVVNPNSTLDVSATVAGLQIDGTWRAFIGGATGATLTLASGGSSYWDSGSLSFSSTGGLVGGGSSPAVSNAGLIEKTGGSVRHETPRKPARRRPPTSPADGMHASPVQGS
jgi:hypothetical protein